MGCNSLKPEMDKEHEIVLKIIDCIKHDDCPNLEKLIMLYSHKTKKALSEVVNKRFIEASKLQLNMLAFTVLEGKRSAFTFLSSSLNASVLEMEEVFYQYRMSTLGILCEKGYTDVLKAYLPMYAAWHSQKLPKIPAVSISNDQVVEDFQPVSIPIQAACKNGHISIIYFVHSFFTGKSALPALDIHAIDRLTGENCALVAVRTGNFIMIKMLFENLEADFHLKNNKNDGALQIIVKAAKNNCSLEYFECVMYLIEVVKIDVSYKYEETLIEAQNMTIVKYLKENLKKIGINPDQIFNDKKNFSSLASSPDKSTRRGELSSIMQDSDISNFIDISHLENLNF